MPQNLFVMGVVYDHSPDVPLDLWIDLLNRDITNCSRRSPAIVYINNNTTSPRQVGPVEYGL